MTSNPAFPEEVSKGERDLPPPIAPLNHAFFLNLEHIFLIFERGQTPALPMPSKRSIIFSDIF